jgi:MoaA/NifB/PqqE/SkfB family radical SAM enzyme
VDWIYFEGGEPFLYYRAMIRAIEIAHEMGFRIGVVTNAYWARTFTGALEKLQPLAGRIDDLSISSDWYHYSKNMDKLAHYVLSAAEQLEIPIGVITVAQPEETHAALSHGQIEAGSSAVMYRGRAVEQLVPRVDRMPFEQFTECSHEDLRQPGRVHLDPFGNVHICQGIVIGNLFETALKEICDRYEPDSHAICGPLLKGGPVTLMKSYDLEHESTYADACHMCYEARTVLRNRFPEVLTPDQMYGVTS